MANTQNPAPKAPEATACPRPHSPADSRAQRFAQKDELVNWFPQIDADLNNDRRIWLSRRSQALCIQFILIGAIFVVNTGLTIFAAVQYGSKNGVGLIYEGSCETVKELDQWLHLLINLLSTGMLGASSYGMQLQAAPTRADIDKAHRNGTWLDIGTASIRNLGHVGNWRRFAWAVLALSSVPIHLIYNSAIFQSLSSTVYTVAVVKDSFMNGASWSTTTAENNRAGHSAWDESRVNPDSINGTPVNYTRLIADMQQHAITNPNLYQNMNASDCFRYYDDYWKPQGDALVFVTNSSLQTDPNDSLLLYVTVVPRSDDWAKNMWALSNGTNQFVASSGDVQISSSNTPWVLGPPRLGVARCLVRDAPARASRCRFEYSPPIMWTVCCLNFVKATVMLSIWLLRARQRDVRTPDERDVLYTLGDAISSFMRRPDEDTKDKGLSGMKDFRQSRSIKRGFTKRPRDGIQPHPRQLEMESIRWMRAASIRKWCVFLCACLLVIGVAAGLLAISIPSLRHRRLSTTIKDLWNMGFGALTPYTYLVIGLPKRDPGGLILNVLLANLPQLILSVLYILLNSMLSTFMVQREFDQMDTKRKPLRVSEPTGIQRSSYFISLPLRYGVPFYVTSGLMHWLISQSLFLARVTAVLPDDVVDQDNSFSTTGYSPIAIFITLLAGLALVGTVVVASFFLKYKGTMALVSTNSRAIAAACHALPEDRSAGHLLPVKWGVIEYRDGVGKCAFTTAADMKEPKKGSAYM